MSKDLIEKEEKLALYFKDECKGVIISYELYKKLAALMEKIEEEAEYQWIMQEFGDKLTDPDAKYHKKPEGIYHKGFIKKMTDSEDK